jgi:hypothetical protein
MSERPAAGGALEMTTGKVTSRIPPANDIRAQLRRRREASLRLPPLADGRRDPLDPPLLTDQDRAVLRYVWRLLARHGLLTAGMKAELSRIASLDGHPIQVPKRREVA